MGTIFRAPKSMWKSRTFWITLAIMVCIVIVGMLQDGGVKIPVFVAPMIVGLAGVFVGQEKIKDGKETSIMILNNIEKNTLLKMQNQLVNEKSAQMIGGIAVVLNTVLATMSANGAVISPWVYGSLNSLASIFIGFDKYKEMVIKSSAQLSKKK